MQRKFLVLAVGVGFLVVMTWLGTIITSVVPQHPTAQTQSARTASFQVTLQVNPNPPPITRSTAVTLQVINAATGQRVANAQVSMEYSMQTMDMGTERVVAQSQHDGLYFAQFQFSMSGPWQVRTLITVPGKEAEDTAFDITVQ